MQQGSTSKPGAAATKGAANKAPTSDTTGKGGKTPQQQQQQQQQQKQQQQKQQRCRDKRADDVPVLCFGHD